jgi:hypothetical protein
MGSCVGVRDDRGSIGRTVVNDEDFHILSALQQ